MWGALSPTQNVTRSLAEELATAEAELKAEGTETPTKAHQTESTSNRNIGQAEIESSLYKVSETGHLNYIVCD